MSSFPFGPLLTIESTISINIIVSRLQKTFLRALYWCGCLMRASLGAHGFHDFKKISSLCYHTTFVWKSWRPMLISIISRLQQRCCPGLSRETLIMPSIRGTYIDHYYVVVHLSHLLSRDTNLITYWAFSPFSESPSKMRQYHLPNCCEGHNYCISAKTIQKRFEERSDSLQRSFLWLQYVSWTSRQWYTSYKGGERDTVIPGARVPHQRATSLLLPRNYGSY